MIGDRLRYFRRESGLTQMDISQLLGIDRTTYTFYETGATRPSYITIAKLSLIYKITVDTLIGTSEIASAEGLEYESRLADMVKIANAERLLPDETERLLCAYFRLLSAQGKEKALDAIKEISKTMQIDLS